MGEIQGRHSTENKNRLKFAGGIFDDIKSHKLVYISLAFQTDYKVVS